MTLYDIWHGMVRRCHDPTRKDYSKYGGRGIRVCDEWLGSRDRWTYAGYMEFEAWSMNHGYKDGMTLDRICNNRGYGPNNCRWITKHAQAYNRKTNVYLTYGGRTMTLKEWSKETGLSEDRLHKRMKAGWDAERTLTTPVHPSRRGLEMVMEGPCPSLFRFVPVRRSRSRGCVPVR